MDWRMLDIPPDEEPEICGTCLYSTPLKIEDKEVLVCVAPVAVDRYIEIAQVDEHDKDCGGWEQK